MVPISELLGEARILIRPDTVAFRAQLEEQLAFARKPIVIPVVAGVGGSFASVQKEATASALGLADAVQVQTSALGRDAVLLDSATEASAALAGAQTVTAERTAALTAVQREQAASAALAVRRTAQLERGVASTTLSQFGLRGATLAASGAFIAGAAAITLLSRVLKDSVGASESLALSTERLKETVGTLTATRVTEWAGGLANSLGIAKVQAVDFAATLLGLFKNFGVTGEAAVGMSEELIKVAGNLSLIQHVPVEAVLLGIQRGLAGNGRALRSFNIFVDQSRVAQEALVETGKQQTSQLTRSELVTARYNLILRDSADRMDAFAVSSRDLTAQQRILGANLSNIETEIGGPLVFALNAAITSVNNLIVDFGLAGKATKELGNQIPFVGGALDRIHIPFQKVAGDAISLGIRMALLGPEVGIASVAFDKFRDHIRGAGETLSVFDSITSSVQKTLGGLVDALDKVGERALKAATNTSSALEVAQLKIQTGLTGGGRAAEEANLRQQIQADQGIVALTKSGTAARKKALQELHSDQLGLQALLAQDASDAQKSASDAKAAADKIKSARQAADQAILDAISGRQAAIEFKVNLHPGNLRLEKALLQFFIDTRNQVRNSALSAKEKSQEIVVLTREIIQQRQTVKDALAAAAQTALDTRQQILELTVQTAQASGNKAAEERADKQLIAFLLRQIKKHKGNRLLVAQLRLELAQTRADLKALGKDQTATSAQAGKTFADLAASILTTQHGFASQLASNILPSTARISLNSGRGGVPGSTGTGRGTSGGFGELSAASRGAAAEAARAQGGGTPTRGQGDVQIHLMRQTVNLLKRLVEGDQHPEATHQRKTLSHVVETRGD